jgi:hypothetical protein
MADDGSFQLAVDPGTYDVFVRPKVASGLPWTVLPGLTVSRNLNLGPVLVPPPSILSLVLRDPAENPVVRAVVRAYAATSPGAPSVLIGEAQTDEGGAFVLELGGIPVGGATR